MNNKTQNMNARHIKPTLYLPSIKNLPIPNFSEFKLPPIGNFDNNKPYKCSECQNTFNRKNSLLRHQRIHSGAKPYECNYCSKRFSRKDILSRHKASLKCQKVKSINENSQKAKVRDIMRAENVSTAGSYDNKLENQKYKHERYIYEHLYLDNFPMHPLLSGYKDSKSSSRESSPLQLPSATNKL
jgi:uncharacterized Zn-finger protein